LNAGRKLPAPYYQQSGITIYHPDCRTILPLLDCVDLVLTDPPCNISQENGDILYTGATRAKIRDFGEWDKAHWDPIPFLIDAVRLLKVGGSLLAFCSDEQVSSYSTFKGLSARGKIV
jgi:DNA modification methylase